MRHHFGERHDGTALVDGRAAKRLRPHVPKPPSKPQVDGPRVLSGILHVKRNGLRWQDAPAVHGPPKTPLQPFRPLTPLGSLHGSSEIWPDQVPTGTPEGALHRGKSRRKGPRAVGRTNGSLNSKLRRVSDGRGQPLTLVLSLVAMSDARGAPVLLPDLPAAKRMQGERL